jgi:anti-sigma regulatory factor (Ser/Thr protein kinase)
MKAIQRTISKPCQPRFLSEVREVLDEILADVEISRKEKDHIILAVDEAASSMVQYAKYKGLKSQITLTVDVDEVRFKATLQDSLNVFDYGTLQSAEHLAQEKSFTMGVFLMRQVMDEISYVYRKGFQNDLELIKFL